MPSGFKPQRISQVRAYCPHCCVSRQMGQHLDHFECIPFQDGPALLCRGCNAPARIYRAEQERPF